MVDRLHGLFAGIGYVTLAATPLLAAPPLLAMGRRRLAVAGIAAGVASAIALALTTTGLPTGLFQRVGLTVTDAWIIAAALAVSVAGGRAPVVPVVRHPEDRPEATSSGASR